MKQLKDDKICKYCFGCNKLLDDNFGGVRDCINFIQAKDMSEYYRKLKGESKENDKEKGRENKTIFERNNRIF